MKNILLLGLATFMKLMAATFIVLALYMMFTDPAIAQTPKVNTDKVVKDTTIKSVSYKVYRGAKGGRYIMVTSKTGNIYKRYLK